MRRGITTNVNIKNKSRPLFGDPNKESLWHSLNVLFYLRLFWSIFYDPGNKWGLQKTLVFMEAQKGKQPTAKDNSLKTSDSLLSPESVLLKTGVMI